MRRVFPVGLVALGLGLSFGLPSNVAGEPPVHCGVDSCWGRGTCEGAVGEIYGTHGNDVLVGTQRDDVIVALAGDDDVHGRGGDDLICGDGGDDRILGGKGDDAHPQGLWCTCGDYANLYGGPGQDVIAGGRGEDNLYGGRGGDALRGGSERDLCSGGDPEPDEPGDVADDTCERARGVAVS